MRRLRKWLSDIRKKENATMLEVANKSGISESYYSLIENGKREPHQKIAKKIADALNFENHRVSWVQFFEDNSATSNKYKP